MPKKARKLQEIDVFQPFAKYYTGKSERIDLVLSNNSDNMPLRGLEVKLTALPVNSIFKVMNLANLVFVRMKSRISFYIQTFPRSFKFVGTKTEQEQMIGNAVPVKLAEYVARSIAKYLEQPHRARNLEIDFENFLSFSQILY